MINDPDNRQSGRVVLGLFIVAVGVFALLDNLHLFDSHLVQPFWPLVFVALGTLKLAGARRTGHYLVGSGLVALGAGMTLQNLGLYHFELRQLWPLALILMGLNILTRGFGSRRRLTCDGTFAEREARLEHGSRVDTSATLSGIVLKNDSPDFTGGDISAVMGGVELDLRQANIAGDAVLRLSVIMGGVEIRVPPDWSVVVRGSPILGGIEDKTVPPMTPGKRLIIEGSVIMGGVEITN